MDEPSLASGSCTFAAPCSSSRSSSGWPRSPPRFRARARSPSERGSTTQSFPPSTERDEAPPSATPAPEPEFELAELSFDAARDQTRRVAPGPATVSVEVDQPGQVQIEDLGVSAAGDPLTPAIFDLFVSDSGRHEITFTPADGNESRSAGTLVVEPDPG